jgi:hypothetical protein
MTDDERRQLRAETIRECAEIVLHEGHHRTPLQIAVLLKNRADAQLTRTRNDQ